MQQEGRAPKMGDLVSFDRYRVLVDRINMLLAKTDLITSDIDDMLEG